MTQDSMQSFVNSLDGIPVEAKRELAQLTPGTYVGNAAQQARELQKHM